MSKVRNLIIAGSLLAALALPAAAKTLPQIGVNSATGDVTLTTTAETVIISSGAVKTPGDTASILVCGEAQLTTGTNTTSVTPRIRRGTATSGTLLGEANAVTIGAAAGSTEVFRLCAFEQRSATESVEYSFTLSQAGASANGSALQGSIFVFVF